MPDTGSGFVYFRSGADRASAEPASAPQVAPADDYPEDGTIPEVKDWIGDDLDRAQTAYDREQEKSNPRSTLLDYLDSLLSDDDDDA